ncbi:MAG TPA: type II toxin-antitoxin system HicA family toxin [Coriobacteriia bacterium]|jgi:predicted RNA binding protein YcfA (HicA-like mRNA interferase family)
MPWTARELRTALLRAGFVELRQRGSHMRLQRVELDGERRHLTLPMHSGDVPPGTLRAILREAGLSEADLRRLLGD